MDKMTYLNSVMKFLVSVFCWFWIWYLSDIHFWQWKFWVILCAIIALIEINKYWKTDK